MATPFQQIESNDPAGLRRGSGNSGMADGEGRGGGKPIPLSFTGKAQTSRPVRPQYELSPRARMCFVAAVGDQVQQPIWDHFPHGSVSLPPALNWNDLPARGRPQRTRSLSLNSHFTATFAYHSRRMHDLRFQAGLSHPKPEQGSEQEALEGPDNGPQRAGLPPKKETLASPNLKLMD